MTQEVTTVLNHLLQTLKDGELGFQAAAVDTIRPDLKAIFEKYSAQRAEFAHALQSQMEREGEEPVDSGTLAGVLHRGWIDLKSAVVTRDTFEILEECERGEDEAMKAYRDALASLMIGSARPTVEEQFLHIRAAHNEIRDLRDAARPAPDTSPRSVVL